MLSTFLRLVPFNRVGRRGKSGTRLNQRGNIQRLRRQYSGRPAGRYTCSNSGAISHSRDVPTRHPHLTSRALATTDSPFLTTTPRDAVAKHLWPTAA